MPNIFAIAPLSFLAAGAVAIISILIFSALSGPPADYQPLTRSQIARAYCATQEQAHYCYEVAVQEGLNAVLHTHP